jgi:hypothetical protein
MTLNRTATNLLAVIGAAAAVVIAVLAPLPRAVLSEEELAAGRMPETRQATEQSSAAFQAARGNYRTYVASNDVGAILTRFERAAGSVGKTSGGDAARAEVRAAAEPLNQYLGQLGEYAAAGDAYFAALRHYDDELMAWTRSLGAESESLRSATWPIVEYLKRYPPPVGLDASYTWVGASDVMSRSEKLRSNIAYGDSETLLADSQAVREAGRSVEYIESLHPEYEQILRGYDDNLRAVLAAGASVEPDARRTVATMLDVAVAVVVGLGIAGLLVPRIRGTHEASV